MGEISDRTSSSSVSQLLLLPFTSLVPENDLEQQIEQHCLVYYSILWGLVHLLHVRSEIGTDHLDHHHHTQQQTIPGDFIPRAIQLASDVDPLVVASHGNQELDVDITYQSDEEGLYIG